MKRGVEGTIRVNVYTVMARAVAEGVYEGWRRAYKRGETPHEENVRNMITGAVMTSICDVFKFDSEVAKDGSKP